MDTGDKTYPTIERKFPGWGRNLIDSMYKPYVVPPMFPTDNRP